METKTLYVKGESYVITADSLVKAILLSYKKGLDNGIMLSENNHDIAPSEQILKEVFEILEDGMADIK